MWEFIKYDRWKWCYLQNYGFAYQTKIVFFVSDPSVLIEGEGGYEKSAYILQVEFEETNPTKITKVTYSLLANITLDSNQVAELDGINWIDDRTIVLQQRFKDVFFLMN